MEESGILRQMYRVSDRLEWGEENGGERKGCKLLGRFIPCCEKADSPDMQLGMMKTETILPLLVLMCLGSLVTS